MQKIIVKSVQEKHSKDGSKTFYVVTDSKGADLSSFDPEVMVFQPGTVIEAEVEVSGKYTNLKEFKVVSNPMPNSNLPTTNGRTYGQDSPEKRRSIERQTALSLAIDWTKFALEHYDGKIQSHGSEPLTCAETFYQWIAMPVPLKSLASPPIPPKTEQGAPASKTTNEKPTASPLTAKAVTDSVNRVIHENL